MGKRRIKKAKISFISLCPRGKNNLPAIYKADGSVVLDTIVKTELDFLETGELTAIVYPAELRDVEGDIAAPDVVKEFAYDYMRSGGNIDIRHDGTPVTKEQAYVAENFIVQKNDPRFIDFQDYDGNPVDPVGSWGVVIKIDDPELRSLYKEDGWQGVSMFGHAVVEQENLDKELLNMDKEELKKMFSDFGAELITNITKALTPEATENTSEPDQEPVAPVFKGDASDPKAVEVHLKKLERYNLSKDVDFNDTEQVKEYMNTLAKIADDEKEEEGTEKPSTPDPDTVQKIAEYKKKITDLEKSSNQPAPDAEFSECGISKEDATLIKSGREMAAFINKQGDTTTYKLV